MTVGRAGRIPYPCTFRFGGVRRQRRTERNPRRGGITCPSKQACEATIASGMERGVAAGYDRLAELSAASLLQGTRRVTDSAIKGLGAGGCLLSRPGAPERDRS